LKTGVYEIRAHSDVFQQFVYFFLQNHTLVVGRRKRVEALLPAGDGRRADWEGKIGVQIGKRLMCNRRWQGRCSLACRRVE
jgi:2-keto-4-pentenoate hydratase/2-oxohepta-3-ene-1,7-dioic acid hydratase in catechol pathway